MRKPSFSGLTPQPLGWNTASSEQINFFKSVFEDADACIVTKREDTPSASLSGYFRVQASLASYFVKAVAHDQSKAHSESISSWLSSRQFPTVDCIQGFPKTIRTHNLVVFAYPFLNSRFPQSNSHDLFLIGESTGSLHSHLHLYPDQNYMADISSKHHSTLLDSYDEIVSGSSNVPIPSVILDLFNSFSRSNLFLPLYEPQLLHGDLNPGNILFETGSNRVFLIDYEESPLCFFSRLYDIAFVLQRLVLNSHDTKQFDLASSFMRGYRSKNSCRIFPFTGSLLIMLQFICIRSLLILYVNNVLCSPAFAAEVSKFLRLYETSHKRKDLLACIEQLY